MPQRRILSVRRECFHLGEVRRTGSPRKQHCYEGRMGKTVISCEMHSRTSELLATGAETDLRRSERKAAILSSTTGRDSPPGGVNSLTLVPALLAACTRAASGRPSRLPKAWRMWHRYSVLAVQSWKESGLPFP